MCLTVDAINMWQTKWVSKITFIYLYIIPWQGPHSFSFLELKTFLKTFFYNFNDLL